MFTVLLMPTPKSEKRKAKSEKRKAKSEKRKAKSEKRKAKSLSDGFYIAISPYAVATHTHLFALTASHFLSNAAKSNQKTLRSHHPAPTLRSGVPSLRPCSREDRAAGPILGPSA